MSDCGVVECANRAFLMTDIQSDHPSDIGEKTLMATTKGSKKSISSEYAPIEGDDPIITPKEGSIVVYKPSEELLRVINSKITPEGGTLDTLASDMKVDVCQGSESSGSQLLMETTSLHIYEEVPLHQDVWRQLELKKKEIHRFTMMTTLQFSYLKILFFIDVASIL